MKFSVSATNFASALALVMKSINTKLSIVGGRGVLLVADRGEVTLTGTDLDTMTRITLAATVDQPGRMLLAAEELAGAFRSPSASLAVFSRVGNDASLVIGRTRFNNLPMMDADNDFPHIQEVPDEPVLVLPGAQLQHAAGQVSFACAKPEENAPALMGTAFRFKQGHVQVVATDRSVVAELKLPYGDDTLRPAPGEEIVLPPSSLDRIQNLFDTNEAVRVSREKGWASFRNEGREFFTKMQADPFPAAIDPVLEQAHANLRSWMECDRKLLLDAVMRMNVVARRAPIYPVRFRTEGSKLHLFSSTGSTAEDTVDIEGDGPDFFTCLNGATLKAVLEKIPGDRVRIDLPENDVQQLIFTPANTPEGTPPYALLQVPINPGAPEAAATLAGPRR